MKTSSEEKAVSLFGEDPNDEAICPICLDELPPMTWTFEGRLFMPCCGNFYCKSCDWTARRKGIVNKMNAIIDQSSAKWRSLMNEYNVLSKCPLCREEIGDGIDFILRRAKAGSRQAQYWLAIMYQQGDDGVEIDLRHAAYWFRTAADQGVAAAMHRYSRLLAKGEGCTKSETEAFHWMEKSADAGFIPAKYYLSCHYEEGFGVEKNDEKSVQLLKEAYEGGYHDANGSLGKRYVYGNGVERDVEKAFSLLTIAAEGGGSDAQYELGMLYKDKKNYDQTMKWLKKAADQGDRDAFFALGDALLLFRHKEGQHIEIMAVKLFRQAAALGHEKAIEELEFSFQRASSKCFQCKKERSENTVLLKCTNCKLLHYCSKKCQKRHWKAGHKNDCSAEFGTGTE